MYIATKERQKEKDREREGGMKGWRGEGRKQKSLKEDNISDLILFLYFFPGVSSKQSKIIRYKNNQDIN